MLTTPSSKSYKGDRQRRRGLPDVGMVLKEMGDILRLSLQFRRVKKTKRRVCSSTVDGVVGDEGDIAVKGTEDCISVE